MSALPISVITCTYNPKPHYFRRVLDALRTQTLPVHCWEYLVIDNGSNQPVAETFDFSWASSARLLREDKPGLTPARLRGIREARGELLIFVDDDNVLDPDYLEQARRVALERPWLGAWSGQCLGEFEEAPPEWTRPYWGNLVIREFNEEVWSNLPRLAATMPCGAGMVVRREVARRYLVLNDEGQRRFQLDRVGTSLLSGGDNDLAGCACTIDFGVGLIPKLKLRHLIPPFRLTEDYLKRLSYGIHYSAVLLDAEYGVIRQPRSRLGRLADWLRLQRLRGPNRAVIRAAMEGEEDATRTLMDVRN